MSTSKIIVKLDPEFTCYDDMEPGSAYGVIKFNDFYEHFYMSSSFWSIEDYQRQWQLAIDRLNSGQTTCFIVNFQPLTPWIDMWIAYHVGDKLYIQNRYLIGDFYHEILGENFFTPENSFDFIPKRETITEEGNKVSEWVIQLTN